MNWIKRISLLALCLAVIAATVPALAAGPAGTQFKVLKKLALEGGTRWDYVLFDRQTRELYISRATHVVVLNADSGALLADMPAEGVHGVTLAPKHGIGFISNGVGNNVSVFDLKSFKVIGKIQTGENPDSIFYHPATDLVFVQNGKSNSSTVIDAASRQVVATIPLGGKPEFWAYDDKGDVFINLEDKNAIAVVNAATKTVKATWSVAPCEEPTGMAYDPKDGLLFSACGNKLAAVTSAKTGRVIQTFAIGDDCDGIAFDPETGYVFASNGDGTLTLAHKDAHGKYAVLQNLATPEGSKTIALDPDMHRVFVTSAKFPTDPKKRPRPNPVPGSVEVMVIGQ